MEVVLAATYHDPTGRLCEQIERVLPVLTSIFGRLAIRASHVANEESLALFASADALIEQESPNQADRDPKIGRARREATAFRSFSRAIFQSAHESSVSEAIGLQIPRPCNPKRDTVLQPNEPWPFCHLETKAGTQTGK